MATETDKAASLAGSSGASALRRRKSATANRWLARKLYDGAGRPPVQLRLWDGSEIGAAADSTVACVVIRDPGTLFRLLAYPDLYFGEAYMHGKLEVEGDLTQCLEAFKRARSANSGTDIKTRVRDRILSRRRRNTPDAARGNIHHHYDLGNAFYQLWLDRAAMQYTCAYFPHTDATLEEAQLGKLDHICRKLRLQPGDEVVEAGSGWGGLACYMARHYGARVKAFNISQEQVAFAQEQARAEGLDDRVTFIEDDYRNVAGRCDKFVSVGMLEHVGPEHYPAMAEAIDRVLKPDGLGLIHTIGRNRDNGPMNAWIEKRIFPGAHPPSLREMMDVFEHRDFSVQDVENLRLHYAATLGCWLQRYEQQLDAVRGMFDEPFVRAWRLYLAGCKTAFTTGEIQLFQVVFNRATANNLPLTRAYIYAGNGEEA